MKAYAFVLLLVFCYAECRKTYAPIDKNANIAFINMEGGAGVRPATVPPAVPQAPIKTPAAPTPAPQANKPVPQAVNPLATTVKPIVPTTVKQSAPAPVKTPSQITPIPIYPTPASKPITTPGPGSVKQLITFYDSQGKASPIRPYSYSQAVKQG